MTAHGSTSPHFHPPIILCWQTSQSHPSTFKSQIKKKRAALCAGPSAGGPRGPPGMKRTPQPAQSRALTHTHSTYSLFLELNSGLASCFLTFFFFKEIWPGHGAGRWTTPDVVVYSVRVAFSLLGEPPGETGFIFLLQISVQWLKLRGALNTVDCVKGRDGEAGSEQHARHPLAPVEAAAVIHHF